MQDSEGFLTDRINKDLGMVNGTRIRYHSLVPCDEKQRKFIGQQMASSKPGDVITLQQPPAAINVVLVEEEVEYNEDEMEDMEPSEKQAVLQEMEERRRKSVEKWKKFSVIPGRVVVPIVAKRINADWKKIQVYGGQGFLASRVQIKAHFPLEPAFSITIHKAQGQTLRNVILALSHRGVPKANMSYASLYVAMSRVHAGKDIRLLLRPSKYSDDVWGSLEYISTLEPDMCIRAFFAGFAKNRYQWDSTAALETLQKLQRQTKKNKNKAQGKEKRKQSRYTRKRT